ncbi:hypothetical protein [Undibacterium sp. Di24W]|uniref:hypothetical protein n=1 Tax=Undibacterium sp. Di24W TaxID=3413033 RepID=UPI003BF22E66
MNIFLKALLVTFVLFVGGFFVVPYFYFVYPIDSFCKGIKDGDNREEIAALAQSKGFFPKVWQGTDTIWIFNHDQGTMFRLACSVDFKDGKVSKKEVVDAD